MAGNMTGVRGGRDRRKPGRVCVARGVQGSLLYRERERERKRMGGGSEKEEEGCGQYALVIFANH